MDMFEILLSNGADINAKDISYKKTEDDFKLMEYKKDNGYLISLILLHFIVQYPMAVLR